MWEPWKHRNGIVFDGATPSLGHVTRRIEVEGRAWMAAGLLRTDFAALLVELVGGNAVSS